MAFTLAALNGVKCCHFAHYHMKEQRDAKHVWQEVYICLPVHWIWSFAVLPHVARAVWNPLNLFLTLGSHIF